MKKQKDWEHEISALLEYLSQEKERHEMAARSAGEQIEQLQKIRKKMTVVDGCSESFKRKEPDLADLDLEE